MTCGRVTAPLVTFLLTLGLAQSAEAQSLSGAPPVDPTATSTIAPRASAMFAAGQIVDRPTADLRPRFHWGLFGSVIPRWSTPPTFGPLGNPFSENVTSAKMNGRDLRVGVVRARQLGFEMGVSFVLKTVTSMTSARSSWPPGVEAGSITYSTLDDIRMMGVDSHLVIPIARIGERFQLGVLAAGGLAWIPDASIQRQIDGPPFYADAASTVPLSSPPVAGGVVLDPFSGQRVPLVPGTTHAVAPASFLEISGTDYVWPLLRGQLAADFLLARPLKLRLAAGFHYPGVQAIGVDVVYLFRTGRLDAARIQPSPSEPAAAAGIPPAQIADRPQVIAPRRSYWGVLGGAAPSWFTPRWSEFFRDLAFEEPFTLKGKEFRVGLTRGRPLGKEFGVSFVRKSWTQFSFVRQGLQIFNNAPGQEPQGARITLTELDPVQVPGIEFHSFIPIDRIGPRVQLGGLLSIGAARVPDTAIQKRIEGPPFVASATSSVGLATLPAGGGFVLDDNGQALPVASGQTAALINVSATEISPLSSFLLLARAQIAADVLIAAPLKLRVSAGFNYPGAQLFGIEMVYLFGTGGN